MWFYIFQFDKYYKRIGSQVCGYPLRMLLVRFWHFRWVVLLCWFGVIFGRKKYMLNKTPLVACSFLASSCKFYFLPPLAFRHFFKTLGTSSILATALVYSDQANL
jgi:hypothetical protein